MVAKRRRRDLARDILIYMDVVLPVFVHPHQLAKKFNVTIGAARHALHLLTIRGQVLQPFRRLVRGGWMKHVFERRRP